jgi:hypothetical protein
MQINATKVTLYVVLLIAAIYCGRQFLARYGKLMTTEVDTDPYALNEDRPDARPPAVNSTNTASTVASDTNQTVNVGATNIAITTLTGTNRVADTNEPPPRARATQPEFLTKRGLERGRAPDTSGIALYAFGMFGVVIALGILVAHDVAIFMAQRAHKLLHNDEGEGIHSVEYDKAEEVWANGDHLEAIKLMRAYLLKNPREVHVMARIAEIYEKDLANFLAAALEYEEFLKHKHLVNLYYGKLDRPTQGLALLWRIHREYGQTQAAEKARKRLAQIDPDFAAEQERRAAEAEAADDQANAEAADEPDAPAWQPPGNDADSQLPKGFRPKKR